MLCAERYEIDFDLQCIVLTSTTSRVPIGVWTFDTLSPAALVDNEYLEEFLDWLPEQ